MPPDFPVMKDEDYDDLESLDGTEIPANAIPALEEDINTAKPAGAHGEDELAPVVENGSLLGTINQRISEDTSLSITGDVADTKLEESAPKDEAITGVAPVELTEPLQDFKTEEPNLVPVDEADIEHKIIPGPPSAISSEVKPEIPFIPVDGICTGGPDGPRNPPTTVISTLPIEEMETDFAEVKTEVPLIPVDEMDAEVMPPSEFGGEGDVGVGPVFMEDVPPFGNGIDLEQRQEQGRVEEQKEEREEEQEEEQVVMEEPSDLSREPHRDVEPISVERVSSSPVVGNVEVEVNPTLTPTRGKRKRKEASNTPSTKKQFRAKTDAKGKNKIKSGTSSNPISIPDIDIDLSFDLEDELDKGPKEEATLYPHGLGPVTTTINNHFLYVYFRFCAERHKMYVKRMEEGVARDNLTQDECMRKERVGNIYRELDPSSLRLRDEVIGVGNQSNEEICFRVFLYSGFYEDSTWYALVEGLGEIPSWKNFNLDKYEAILYERSVVQKKVIYTSAFQLVPPTIYFGRNLPHFAATLRFIKSLMESELPAKLLDCKYAVDASHILQTYPTLGGFLSLCMLCSLNVSPRLNFQLRNFATCGPGSRAYLQRIFGKSVINSVPMEQAGLKWLYDNQWRYWARIGVDPPHAWQIGIRPGMRVLDLENALCWCHRYVNAYQRKGYSSLADLPDPCQSTKSTKYTSMSAWCDEYKNKDIYSRPAFIGDYEEESQKQEEEQDSSGIWEVEKVICRKGMRTDKDGLFRVRWKGYPPEEDTWERASSLREGAEDALKEWIEWEQGVWATIAKVTVECPYTRPFPVKVESKIKIERDVKPVVAGRRTGTRSGTAGRSTRTAGSSIVQEEIVKTELVEPAEA